MAFPEFTGGNDYEASKEYIKAQFLAQVGDNQDRLAYSFICAYDQTSIASAMTRFAEHFACHHINIVY